MFKTITIIAVELKYISLSLFLFFQCLVFGQTIPITIMTYNTSDAGGVWSANSPSRVANMRNVISAINPDIIVAIEIYNSNTDAFLDYVLNYNSPGTYSKGTFIANNNAISPNSNCLYYKTAKFDGGSFDNTVIPAYLDLTQTTRYRDINKFTITQNGGSTIIIYAVHLIPDGSKTFDGSSTTRANQISYLHSYLENDATTSTDNYIVLGDFNIKSPDEGAYKNLFVSQGGYFYDPSNPSDEFGSSWNTSTFIPYLSFQSTQVKNKFDNILISGNVKDNLQGIEYHSNSYTVYGNPNNYGSTSTDTDASSASDHLPVYAVFDFSDGAAPVELVSFTGRIKDGEVGLDWNTATEVNNYGFEIERSTDKFLWDNIGFVPGNGNSNAPKNYSFIDKSIPSGAIYYRLKQEDFDGKFEYSNVIKLEYKFSSKPSLSQNYPNPFNPASVIKYTIPTNGIVSLKIYDVLGREVAILVNKKQNAGNHSVNFNGASLTSGIYIYVLTTNDFVLSKKMNLLK
ncbi:MAG TPA: T9SS type A sorting domain-containing protein [Ignavibacteriaceae bacterium]|nr:T9SS type A sorting domain-containing protein [Ignavibacteriaceae bacterium]